MKLNKYLIIALILTVFWNIQCAIYKSIPLDFILNNLTSINSIYFDYKIFNKKDCKKYLGRDKIISKGYTPIQISLVNNTDKTFSINTNNFSFPCVSHQEVAQKVHFNLIARVVGWAIGGIFIWPFWIGSVVEGVQTPDANNDLDIDYSQKSLKNQIIQPNNTINALIFVENAQLRSNFSFKIVDTKTNEQFELSSSHKKLEIGITK